MNYDTYNVGEWNTFDYSMLEILSKNKGGAGGSSGGQSRRAVQAKAPSIKGATGNGVR